MWRRIWGPHPADAKAEREMNAQLTRHWITSGLFLGRLLGNYPCGMVALEAHFTDHPEVTPEYVSVRLDNLLSEDTTRRRLTEMVKAGVMTSRKEGRAVYFRMTDDIAETAIAFMKGEPIVIPASREQAA